VTLYDIFRALEDVGDEYGFEACGIVGGVVWGFLPGDERLWACNRLEGGEEFAPCDQARWATLTGAPMPRNR